MPEFEPPTEQTQSVHSDDQAVPSEARSLDSAVQKNRKRLLRLVLLVAATAGILAGYAPIRVIAAALVSYLLLLAGFVVIGSFARPVPEPPPPGELRRVKLTYRCPTCGTELKMTLANDQVPAPPRHCSDEMEITVGTDEL